MGISVARALVSFGDNIRTTRLKRGVSQEELAQRAGIERSYMGQIERGEGNPSFKKIVNISNALGVAPRDLIA